MTDVTEQRPSTGMSSSTLKLTLGFDYVTSNFGRFSLMPVLAMLLASQGNGASWATTGIGMFGFMLCAGMSSLLAIKWLPRIPYVVTLPASMVFSAVGFGLLPYTRNPVATMVPLFVAGFGISVHAVLSRVLIAEVIQSETGRNTVYSMQQIATNAAAALGPFIAGALYVSGDGRPLLGMVGVAYLLAGVSLLVGLPRGLRPPDTVRERTRGVAAGLQLLRDGETRRVTVVTAVGTFVYAQFYSAFALLVALAIDSTLLESALLAGPPIAIVFLQALVTAIVNRYLRVGVPPLLILTLATLVFATAMLLLGIGLPVVIGATAAMAVFAVAEMLFTPMVSTAFNGISGVSRLAVSNLQQVAWTTGEAFGSLCGAAVFLVCYQHGVGRLYWLLLAVATAANAAPYLTQRRTTLERTAI
jgi:MFS family permease